MMKRILVGGSQGRRQFGRRGRGWEGVKMELSRNGMGGRLSGLIWFEDGDKWRALVDTVMNFRVA
jgi:hypothetical protein